MDELVNSDRVSTSIHTNRPITDLQASQSQSQSLVFWCKLCHVRLIGPVSVCQHMKGRVHQNTINKIAQSKTLTSSAGKTQQSKFSEQTSKATNKTKANIVLSEPASKKGKSSQSTSLLPTPTPPSHSKLINHNLPPKPNATMSQLPGIDPNLKCDQCNVKFDSLLQSLHHFKYTSHVIIPPSEPSFTVPTCKAGAYSSNNIPVRDSGLNPDQPNPVQQNLNQPNLFLSDPDELVQMKCEDCNITLNNADTAKEHFNGKRHKKTMLAKEAAAEKNVFSWWQQSGGGRGAKIGARGGASYWLGRGRRKIPVSSQKANSNIIPKEDLDIALQAILGRRLMNSSSSSYGEQHFNNGMQNNSFHRKPADPYATLTSASRLNRYEPADEFQYQSSQQHRGHNNISASNRYRAPSSFLGQSEVMHPSDMNNGNSFNLKSDDSFSYKNY